MSRTFSAKSASADSLKNRKAYGFDHHHQPNLHVIMWTSRSARYPPPIRMPAASTSAPPSMTFAAAETGGVCM